MSRVLAASALVLSFCTRVTAAQEDDVEKSAAQLITPAAQRSIDQALAFLAAAQQEDGSMGSGSYRGNVAVSALAGEPQAMKELADLAAMGQGLFAPDPVRAWVNYDLAAAAGLKDAEEARDKLAKTMNQRQLNRSRQIAADLK